MTDAWRSQSKTEDEDDLGEWEVMEGIMEQQVPLDRLILNLLALAEAAVAVATELPAGKLTRLASLADDLQPTVDSLAAAGLRIQIELLDEPAFMAAKRSWDTLTTERYGIDLGEVDETLVDNPGDTPATGIEVLMGTVGCVLRDPQAAGRDVGLMQRLSALIRQSFPRPGKRLDFQGDPSQ